MCVACNTVWTLVQKAKWYIIQYATAGQSRETSITADVVTWSVFVFVSNFRSVSTPAMTRKRRCQNVQRPEWPACVAGLCCLQSLAWVILSSNRNKTRPILATAKDFQTELSAFRRCLLMINEILSWSQCPPTLSRRPRTVGQMTCAASSAAHPPSEETIFSSSLIF